MQTTTRLLALVLLVIALPAVALGQSAGDDQYTDPFAQEGDGNSGGQGGQQGGGSQGDGGDTNGTTGTTEVPVPEASVPADQTAAADASSSGTSGLPATGFPAGLLAAAGAGLLVSGFALRRTT